MTYVLIDKKEKKTSSPSTFNSDYHVHQPLKKQYLLLNKCGSKESRYLQAGAAALVWIVGFHTFFYMEWGH